MIASCDTHPRRPASCAAFPRRPVGCACPFSMSIGLGRSGFCGGNDENLFANAGPRNLPAAGFDNVWFLMEGISPESDLAIATLRPAVHVRADFGVGPQSLDRMGGGGQRTQTRNECTPLTFSSSFSLLDFGTGNPDPQNPLPDIPVFLRLDRQATRQTFPPPAVTRSSEMFGAITRCWRHSLLGVGMIEPLPRTIAMPHSFVPARSAGAACPGVGSVVLNTDWLIGVLDARNKNTLRVQWSGTLPTTSSTATNIEIWAWPLQYVAPTEGPPPVIRRIWDRTANRATNTSPNCTTVSLGNIENIPIPFTNAPHYARLAITVRMPNNLYDAPVNLTINSVTVL